MSRIDVFSAMTELPCFAVGQMEGEHLVLGTDDPLDYARRDPSRVHYMDVHHDSSPFGFLDGHEICQPDDDHDEDVGQDVTDEFEVGQETFAQVQSTFKGFEEDPDYARLAELVLSQQNDKLSKQKDEESLCCVCSTKRKPVIRKRRIRAEERRILHTK